MKKKIDERIRILIENCVKLNHRSLFLIVGDRGLYQIVNLHMLLAKARVRASPRVLWCYKNELELSSSKKKRVKQIKKLESKGNLDRDEVDQIELFMSSKDIRYCYYKDSHKILGQTFGLCVLQDFESVTPNVLCRAMETVEGGGMIVMLFNTMTSLRQLYQISMDVHSRFRTEAHQVVQPRFNERFILSLSNCKTCIAIDDELNILPLTQAIQEIKEVQLPGLQSATDGDTVDIYLTTEQKELKDLKFSMRDTKPVGNLVELCRTLDQATSVMQIVDNISERSLKSTVSLTAGRGRGKSAALGISIASAIVYGFSNIFVTAPSPENLQTVFEFVFKGLDALNYREHTDYDILQSTNPDFNHAVVRVNVFKDHRQTIQYIQPQDYVQLSQAELLVVDEAAAIPITLVKQLLGPYMVVLSSTVHGYEGTGRSLSLKLLQSLREQNQQRVAHQKAGTQSLYSKLSDCQGVGGGRSLMETQLEEPIRYGRNDPVERWLSDLLCLDATQTNDQLSFGFPHPSQCELYYVNRDTLFSYHSSSENFLNKLMTIFVSSHYKNTPNDLQMLSDAPAHQIFVLMGSLQEATEQKRLPDILCAIQVSFEGEISKKNLAESLKRGLRPSGDLIPWTISEQFQDDKFGQLNGIRIVRIATHPSAQGRGYGSRALDLLIKYYEGQLTDADSPNLIDEVEQFKPTKQSAAQLSASATLQSEKLKPKKHLKPILQKLSERKPVPVHYIGTSFGVTKELFMFWRKNKLEPVYVRQTANELTGEHTCLMIRPLTHLNEISLPADFTSSDQNWLSAYTADFRRRLLLLMGFEFRRMPVSLAFQLVARHLDKPADGVAALETEAEQANLARQSITRAMLEQHITIFDLKRLESYAKNLVDFHLIMDLVPTLAKLYFLVLPQGAISLSYVQAATLAGMGLQFKTVDQLTWDLKLQANQLLPLFNKAIRKFTKLVKDVFEQDIVAEMNRDEAQSRALLAGVVSNKEAASKLGTQTLEQELQGDGQGTQIASKLQAEKSKFIQKHKISKSMQAAIDSAHLKGDSTVVSIKRARAEDDDEPLEALEQKVRKKDGKKGGNKRARHS